MMGYAMYESIPKNQVPFSWRTALLFVFLANLPDLDFLPGLLLGDPHLYHRHFLSHSLGASAAVGFVMALLFQIRNLGRFFPCFLVFSAVYFSHVFIDFLGVDRTAPMGVPVLWPFSSEPYLAPFAIFMGVKKSNDSSNFIQSLFTMYNLRVALWEFMLFLPVIAVIRVVKGRGRFLAWIAQKL